MDEGSVEMRYIAIIAKSKLVPEDSISFDNTFDSLVIGSLDKIIFSFEIEDAFSMPIPDASSGGLKTVGDIIDGVMRLQYETAAQPVTPTV